MTEALQFLHNDVKLVHYNICPESIIVNKNGSWKLAGFDFCVLNKNPPEQTVSFDFINTMFGSDIQCTPCTKSYKSLALSLKAVSHIIN